MQDSWSNNIALLIAHVGNLTHIEKATGIHRQTINAFARRLRVPKNTHVRTIEAAFGLPDGLFDSPLATTQGPEETLRAAERALWVERHMPESGECNMAAASSFRRALRWAQKKGIPCSAWLARALAREMRLPFPAELAPASDAAEFSRLLYAATPAAHKVEKTRTTAVMRPPNAACAALQGLDFEGMRSAIRAGALDLQDKRVFLWLKSTFEHLHAAGGLGDCSLRSAGIWLYRYRSKAFERVTSDLVRRNNVLPFPAPHLPAQRPAPARQMAAMAR